MTADKADDGWIAATWRAAGNVRALTTTRSPVSASATSGDSVGHSNDHKFADESRQTRRHRLSIELPGLLHRATTSPPTHLQWLHQVHGNRCVRATVADGKRIPQADAVWTEEPNLGLVVLTADCVPIVVASRDGGKVGVAHGGWRGLAGGVVASLITAMGDAASLVAWIGPAIGRDVYEVGQDVHQAMLSAFGTEVTDSVFAPGARPGKWYLDLFALSERLLNAAGVSEVYGERLCTFADPRFHSHRRNGTSSRMATVIWKER